MVFFTQQILSLVLKFKQLTKFQYLLTFLFYLLNLVRKILFFDCFVFIIPKLRGTFLGYNQYIVHCPFYELLANPRTRFIFIPKLRVCREKYNRIKHNLSDMPTLRRMGIKIP